MVKITECNIFYLCMKQKLSQAIDFCVSRLKSYLQKKHLHYESAFDILLFYWIVK